MNHIQVIPPWSSRSSLKWALKFLKKHTKILKSPWCPWKMFLYTVQLKSFFFYPTQLSMADCFTHCSLTQGSTQTLHVPVISWYAHCHPPAIPKWVESQWAKTLILSTQVKQGKIHEWFTPLQSHSKLLRNLTCIFIAVFPPKWMDSQWG